MINFINGVTPINDTNLNAMQALKILQVELSADQSSLSSGENIIVFNTEAFKEGTDFTLQNDGGIKCNNNCKVEINAMVRFGYSSSSTKQVLLYKNSTKIRETSQQQAVANTQTISSYFVSLNQNDVIYLKATDSNSSDRSRIIKEGTFMSVKRID